MPKTPPPLDEDFLIKIFTHHLNRIYNGKCFLRKSLEHLISLASFKGLQLAMEEFSGDVEKQIARMEEIYELIHEKPKDLDCNPITSIIRSILPG